MQKYYKKYLKEGWKNLVPEYCNNQKGSKT
jgi:hypothetical protein